MYHIGDMVIYMTCGLCRVDNLVQKEFNGEMKDYYILKPLNDTKTSLQVQVNNPITLEKIRTLLTKEEVLKLIHELPTIEPYWIDNDNERKRHFSAIMRNGQRTDILGILRSVFEQQKKLKEKGRKLHASDEQYFKDAEKIIYEEFCYVLNIDRKEIANYITDLLEPAIIKN